MVFIVAVKKGGKIAPRYKFIISVLLLLIAVDKTGSTKWLLRVVPTDAE